MNDAEFQEHLNQLVEDQQKQYIQYIQDIRDDAVWWLESRGLPTTSWVADEGGGEWRLSSYIERFCRGSSTADMHAGEVVHLHDGLTNQDPRTRESLIIRIMQAQMKFLISHEQGKVNASSARLDRSKPWAKALAKKLVGEFDKFPDAWRSLRRRAHEHSVIGEYGGYEVEMDLDNDLLIAEDGTSLKKESFRTGEFRNAKRREL